MTLMLGPALSATRGCRRSGRRWRRRRPWPGAPDACGPWPWRPSKLRFEVEAQRSPGASLSAFIARHIEQPGSRHSKPASMKILSQAFGLGLLLHQAGARHDHGVDVGGDLAASATSAAARRSSMRPLVQEPMKTRSIVHVGEPVRRRRGPYRRARAPWRRASALVGDVGRVRARRR